MYYITKVTLLIFLNKGCLPLIEFHLYSCLLRSSLQKPKAFDSHCSFNCFLFKSCKTIHHSNSLKKLSPFINSAQTNFPPLPLCRTKERKWQRESFDSHGLCELDNHETWTTAVMRGQWKQSSCELPNRNNQPGGTRGASVDRKMLRHLRADLERGRVSWSQKQREKGKQKKKNFF